MVASQALLFVKKYLFSYEVGSYQFVHCTGQEFVHGIEAGGRPRARLGLGKSWVQQLNWGIVCPHYFKYSHLAGIIAPKIT